MRKDPPRPGPQSASGHRIGYARVSTVGQSLDEQLEKLEAAKCSKIFEEKISGKKRDRPELIRLLEYVRDGDTLIVTKLDRLARNTFHLHSIAQDLDRKDVDLIVLDQPQIDTTSPLGRLLFSVLGAVADFERGLIVERTEAGKVRARAKGVKFGRKPSLSPDRIAALRTKFEQHVPRTALAKEFGIAPATVYRLCQHITQPSIEAPAPAPRRSTPKRAKHARKKRA